MVVQCNKSEISPHKLFVVKISFGGLPNWIHLVSYYNSKISDGNTSENVDVLFYIYFIDIRNSYPMNNFIYVKFQLFSFGKMWQRPIQIKKNGTMKKSHWDIFYTKNKTFADIDGVRICLFVCLSVAWRHSFSQRSSQFKTR